MRLDRHICDNHVALAESQEELFTSVPDAVATFIEFLKGHDGKLMVDGVPLDLCLECFSSVPLKTVLDNMRAALDRAKVSP